MGEFIITNAFDLGEVKEQSGFISQKKIWQDIQMIRKTVKKFENDKVFYENDDCIILIEGVIFNSKELQAQSQVNGLAKALVLMYKQSETFFRMLDGSFSGYLVDKKQHKILVFVNKVGDHPVFYWHQAEKYIIASNVKSITRLLQENKIEYQLDEIGSYCLLTQGCMLQDITLIEGVRRIGAGHYLVCEANALEYYQYHEFTNQSFCSEKTEQEMIEKLDYFFKKALQKQIDKNNEYDYKHVAQLSAGIDSRTVNYGLASLEVNNVTSVSYSESGYYDQITPMKIAEELKHNWLFKSLDNGLSLFLLDEMVQRNDGLVLHYAPAQVWDTFSKLNREQIGIVYNGIAGDVVAGDYCTENNPLKASSLSDEANSKKLLPKLEAVLHAKNYEIDYKANQEMFLYYNSCFTGNLLGTPLTLQYDCESYSPFYDEEFFAYCLSIPLEHRWDFKLYDKWLAQKYPAATKYLHNGVRKIGTRNNIEFLGRRTNLRKLPRQIKDKLLIQLKLKKKKTNSKNHMNPIDYWYHNNPEVATFMDQYYTNELKQLDQYPEIKEDCRYLYQQGNAIEKTQVLTLLSAVKHLIGAEEHEGKNS